MDDPLYASIYGKSDLPEVLFSLLQPLTSLISVKRDASLEMKGKQVWNNRVAECLQSRCPCYYITDFTEDKVICIEILLLDWRRSDVLYDR